MCIICESKDDHVTMDSSGTVYRDGKIFCLTDSMPVFPLSFCGIGCWFEFMRGDLVKA